METTALVRRTDENALAKAMKAQATLERIAGRAKETIGDDFRAANTQAVYESDWRHFVAWCDECGLNALPSDSTSVGAYVAALAMGDPETDQEPCKPSTIERRLAAITFYHKKHGYVTPSNTPEIREMMKRIRRAKGTAQRRVTPLRVAQLREIAVSLTGSPEQLRDKALLLIGYAGAFRRSELAALTMDDIEFSVEGVKITLRKSKTDQEGHGTIKGIGFGMNSDTCPVKALRAWLESAGITSGPVFRAIDRHGNIGVSCMTGKGISLIIKRIASQFGIDPESVSGHSLRAGFVTDQYAKGTPEDSIMKQTGHKSRAVLSIYHREADVFAFNYTAAAGL